MPRRKQRGRTRENALKYGIAAVGVVAGVLAGAFLPIAGLIGITALAVFTWAWARLTLKHAWVYFHWGAVALAASMWLAFVLFSLSDLTIP